MKGITGALLALLLASCGGGGGQSGQSGPTANPPPIVSRVTPNPVTGSSSVQDLSIEGTGFIEKPPAKPSVVLDWSGTTGYVVPDTKVTFVSATSLRISITTSTECDQWTLKVKNPDGTVSNPVTFQVFDPSDLPSNRPAGFGDVLGEYKQVPAYANGKSYVGRCYNRAIGANTGLMWQCVEYVNRFYQLIHQLDVRVAGENANQYFVGAAKRGLAAFPNAGTTAPQVDDILVFDGGAVDSSGVAAGHAAIVREVDANKTYVRVIQQNVTQRKCEAGSAVTCDGDFKYAMTFNATAGTYSISAAELAGGATPYSTLGWLRPKAQGQTTTLQPGPAQGKDIWTTSVFSYTGVGGGPGGGLDDDMLRVGGWGDEYRALLQFDVSGASLPAQPSSVVLRLYDATAQGNGGTAMTLHRITQFWDWKTQGTGLDRLRLWWADQPSALPAVATARRAATLPAATAGSFYDIDVTDLYLAWKANPGQNFGLELRPTSTSNNWNLFYSSDYLGDPTKRPQLVITP